MKILFCCLVLGALPALGQRDLPIAPITLYTQFQQDPPQVVLEALRDEVDVIMTPMNLHFEWRSLAGTHANEVSVELAVVSFRGRCDLAYPLPRRFRPSALGWTHVSDGAILPFSDVDCDRIRSFVEKELAEMPRRNREQVFGRAVARVLAHELYHIFANTTHHGSWGVGKAAYTVKELLMPGFRFEERESDALRGSKTHTALELGAGIF
jgi:hypothetical protein